MPIKISDGSNKRKSTKSRPIIIIFWGLVFLIFGSLALIYNLPRSLSTAPVPYTFHRTSGRFAELEATFGRYEKTWQQSFPAYSQLFYPPVFIIGGLLVLVSVFSKKKKLKNFLAGLFTVGLGLVLAYFFQSHFPIVLIPIVFVIIGVSILVSVITEKKRLKTS